MKPKSVCRWWEDFSLFFRFYNYPQEQSTGEIGSIDLSILDIPFLGKQIELYKNDLFFSLVVPATNIVENEVGGSFRVCKGDPAVAYVASLTKRVMTTAKSGGFDCMFTRFASFWPQTACSPFLGFSLRPAGGRVAGTGVFGCLLGPPNAGEKKDARNHWLSDLTLMWFC